MKYNRQRAGLTQVEAAVKARMGIRTYQRLESAVALPSIEILFTLSQVLDFKFSEIFSFEEKLSTDLEKIQSLAAIGCWQLNLRTNHLEWSNSLFKVFEIDPQKFNASYEAFLELVHPEDRSLVNEAYTNSLKNQIPYEVCHRLLMKDGRVKWIQERCYTEFSNEGEPLGSTGIAQDITKYVSNQKFGAQ